MLIGVGVVVVLAALATGAYFLLRGGDEAKVRQTAATFASAVDRGDQPGVLSVLCADEAGAITDDDDYDADIPPLTPASGAPQPDVTAATVRGDVAQAVVARTGRAPATIYLTKENGEWKVCGSAESRFATAPH